ncbi:MAG: signal peptide peptidase SppA [Thermoanaerobaculales bacterium]|nr:signal peptide peptidase SppA [Thermoanaerobaculales bacterium]
MSRNLSTKIRSLTPTIKEKLCTLARGIDKTRVVTLNVLFVAIIVGVIIIAFSGGGPDVPKSTTLVVAPAGSLVEQLGGGDPLERAKQELMGGAESETLLKDLIDAISTAKEDERVKALVLDLNNLGGAGVTKLQDLGAVIDDFKTSGKTVIATADNYSQTAYYLAAHADEIYLHPMGMILLEGLGRYRTYYKDGIDRLELDWNVFKVGTFKSAVEPYLRNDMSPAAREANLEWMGDLWQAFLTDVSAARGLSVEDLVDYSENVSAYIEATGGDTAQAALDAGLIDTIATRDEVRARLIELVGEDEDAHSYYRVGIDDYLEAEGGDRTGEKAKGDLVGVVVARGLILGGTQPPGKIGGDSTSALIRQARQDDNVKAIVLRVDSGGGSAFASEIIRRECELAKEDGKPVVISMGSVAASGGYWISMASDEVWAHPTTITGSIGIFGMFPTYQKPLAKYLGWRVDGVGTTRLAGAIRPDRELDPEVGEIIQSIINKGYDEFITLAAEARGVTPEDIDRVGQGRVWSGEDAFELGLVDKMGGLEDAIASAAKLADLGDEFAVKYIEKELDFKQKLVADMLGAASTLLGVSAEPVNSADAPHREVLRLIEDQLEILDEFNDPSGMYAYSWLDVD